jgi:hypothetical protein
VPPRYRSELARTITVRGIATLRLRLGFVNSGIGGGIDDNSRIKSRECTVYSFTMLDVEIRTPGYNDANIAAACGLKKAPSQLPRFSHY